LRLSFVTIKRYTKIGLNIDEGVNGDLWVHQSLQTVTNRNKYVDKKL